jgi:transposase
VRPRRPFWAHVQPPSTLGTVSLSPKRARALRAAAKKLSQWTDERERQIREAHAEGGSYREIAAEVGLSHVGVMKIVIKGQSPAEALLAEQLAEHMQSDVTADQVRQRAITDRRGEP